MLWETSRCRVTLEKYSYWVFNPSCASELWERKHKLNIVYSLVHATALLGSTHRTKAILASETAKQIKWFACRFSINFQGIEFTFQSHSFISSYLPVWEMIEQWEIERVERSYRFLPKLQNPSSPFVNSLSWKRGHRMFTSSVIGPVLCLLCHETPISWPFFPIVRVVVIRC